MQVYDRIRDVLVIPELLLSPPKINITVLSRQTTSLASWFIMRISNCTKLCSLIEQPGETLNIQNIQALGHHLKIVCDRRAVNTVVWQHPFPVVQGQVYREKQNYQCFLANAVPMACLIQRSSRDLPQIYCGKLLFLKAENYHSSVF